VEDHTRHAGLITGLSVGINIAHLARHFLKHAIDCAHMEVHMLVQTGAEPVDEGDCADIQACLVRIGRTRAVGLQALRNDPQKNTQHYAQRCPIVLLLVAQPLGDREHPLAHRQAR
jgi:hypothetical protein